MTQDPTNPTPSRIGAISMTHPEAHIPGYEMPDTVAKPLSRKAMVVGLLVAMVAAVAGFLLEHSAHGVKDATVPLPWVTPFVLLLAGIAAMPFIARHWWEHHFHHVAFVLGAVVAGYYLFFVQYGPGNLARAVAEYISFMFLLGSLFIVSGGILIRVRAQATPAANTVLLLIGAVVANIFGTTGASMLLIRPFLRMNQGRLRPFHVVFFIFIVANAGGSLTPIGDPPLFLGYLKGVPFFWVFEHCWPIWAVANGGLLVVFFVMDSLHRRKRLPTEPAAENDFGPAVSLYGASNLLFIGLILAGILLHPHINHFTHAKLGFEGPWRELLMALAAFGSLWSTPRRIHGENHFNYAPIREVAYLFVGIFLTMIPALNYLYHASSRGGGFLHTPGQYFFTCGSLSSVLDNAPTYLTFLKTELGTLDQNLVDRATTIVKRPGSDLTAADLAGLSEEQQAELRGAIDTLLHYHGDRVSTGSLSDEETRVGFLVGHPKLNLYLVAISMGAVLFGAMTYIGNGPNFMVKSIAEHAGADVPSFFGYVFKFAIPVLLPVLVLIWLIFLR